MARSSGSTVVRRRLGNALRTLREDANIRIDAAARKLECSTAKISRLENGLGPAKNVEVQALLDLYGVEDDAARAQYDEWATQTKSAGWWEPDSDLEAVNARFLALETEAVLVRMFCYPVLPVLLQSPDYNLAHVRDWNPGSPSEEIGRFAEVRQSRQRELLSETNPLRLIAVVDEAAVRRQVGSPEIHASGLLWLADVLDDLARRGRNDVEFRVLPFSVGTPEQAMSAFTLFSPSDTALDPITANVEDSAGETWHESDEVVTSLSSMFDRLVLRSLDQGASRALLRDIVTSGPQTSLSGQTSPEIPRNEGTSLP